MTERRAKRIGIIYGPPTVVVEYERHNSSEKSKDHKWESPSLFHRCFRIENLPQTSGEFSSEAIARKMVQEYGNYFEGISFVQMQRLVDKVLALNLTSKETKPKTCRKPATRSKRSKRDDILLQTLKNLGDLNKANSEALSLAKEEMDTAFDAARIKPGDSDYTYDREVDFGEAFDECSWD